MLARKFEELPKRVRSSTTVNGEIEPPSGGGKLAVIGPVLVKSTPNSFKLSVLTSITKASIAI